ncbi:unnamed protein product [Nesidiocoris tenuis]|uniref:Uncharacterized protein n=1 Tax=Nesidiocoris tenuis TaxID=355587 RepID=A0A6H5GMX8_9HEMI|nr:unnamed protein product [Nesidiocoris tenuis]
MFYMVQIVYIEDVRQIQSCSYLNRWLLSSASPDGRKFDLPEVKLRSIRKRTCLFSKLKFSSLTPLLCQQSLDLSIQWLEEEKKHVSRMRTCVPLYGSPLTNLGVLAPAEFSKICQPMAALAETCHAAITLFSKHGNRLFKSNVKDFDLYAILIRDKSRNDDDFSELCKIRRGAAKYGLHDLLNLPKGSGGVLCGSPCLPLVSACLESRTCPAVDVESHRWALAILQRTESGLTSIEEQPTATSLYLVSTISRRSSCQSGESGFTWTMGSRKHSTAFSVFL